MANRPRGQWERREAIESTEKLYERGGLEQRQGLSREQSERHLSETVETCLGILDLSALASALFVLTTCRKSGSSQDGPVGLPDA